jgi:hypothetical protein
MYSGMKVQVYRRVRDEMAETIVKLKILRQHGGAIDGALYIVTGLLPLQG